MSIALNKNSQAQFSNAVSNIKKFLKEGKLKISEKRQKKRLERGVVYLSHIPHGFYEKQMKDYFSQFGKVLRVRLERSRKTGASKGHAFIQFLHPEVGKIVAETMNNYLMCNRLLKAEYIPPEQQKSELFRGREWNKTYYPKLFNKKATTKTKNTDQDNARYRAFVKKELRKIEILKDKLKRYGIEYDFKFSDIPQDINIEKFRIKKTKENNEISQDNGKVLNSNKKNKIEKSVKTKISKNKKRNISKTTMKKGLLNVDSNQVQLKSVKNLKK